MESHYESLQVVENDNNKETWDFKGQFDFGDSWFLMGSPIPITLIVATYLIFVIKIGPKYMKKRKPYKLTNILTIYNAVQVILSCVYFIFSVRLNMSVGLIPTVCSTETEESAHALATAIYGYFLCKLVDLLDTIFFVLRKKQNQVTFLHVYHHCFILLVSWLYFKYEPGYNMAIVGALNSFVHIIMYAYYGLSAYPSLRKYLWWKKYITKMQLVQFILILLHFSVQQLASHCRPSYILTAAVWSNGFLFLYLFGKFYVNTYLKKNNAKTSNEIYLKSVNGIKHTNGNKELIGKNDNSNESYIPSYGYTDVFKMDAKFNLKSTNANTMNGDHLVRARSNNNGKKIQHKKQKNNV